MDYLGRSEIQLQMSLEDGGTDRGTPDRREGRVTMEVGLGVMGPQAKECGQSPEAGRREDGTLPGASGGITAPAGVSAVLTADFCSHISLLLQATMFVVIWYSSHGKRMQGPSSQSRSREVSG